MALPLSGHWKLSKLFKLSVRGFTIHDGENNIAYLIGSLYELNELISVKLLL